MRECAKNLAYIISSELGLADDDLTAADLLDYMGTCGVALRPARASNEDPNVTDTTMAYLHEIGAVKGSS